MSKDGTVAPKERINIKYVPSTGDSQAEVELPLKLVVLGDFKGVAEDTPIEDRQTITVDKGNFEAVMRESQLAIDASVKNKLSDNDDDMLAVKLTFNELKDFTPDSVAKQVPELSKLVELREALVALKGPLGNVPQFRNSLETLLSSQESRDQLLKELELSRSES
ncbi:type VI secretion system contractile sheath small subunit [Motilimonas sp. KMU-193]|uniref:type VI secretion system contractile sheath small subunit n=1 Tax=Motilimonas sp. KMU-193 TaxID=3388668 RepID=UPI00396B0921